MKNTIKFASVVVSCLCAFEATATMPVNPNRPYTETTCQYAKERLKEAVVGSPLLNSKEQRQTVQDAIRQVERACLEEAGRTDTTPETQRK
ncbi:hypothetical protein [Pseudovibrio sp. Tun.PSC04-5.I4]|uniref:hypothetical protein n=1 Tax=Pseudovibrio sp. Tun.PSC04-5.I4 TaxID=1798213 RepID=UPI000888E938|nr:hypothetical protein [Pseudovibrio sp. Tun.PSC04-5.I4]SDR10543.1 hypothetical protein SAMN04515695_2791 [Pseudovibrio sp. Tun.PSC04-5.I4]